MLLLFFKSKLLVQPLRITIILHRTNTTDLRVLWRLELQRPCLGPIVLNELGQALVIGSCLI